MASLIEGFAYDVFISYRQNDNRSGWVTDFVKALESELAATIKEPVSVYFDSNPKDGLLETHNVDKSLEGKLKCLIFVPILSQTYCDPKGFAWEHEFVAFNNGSSSDRFGRDIKLTGGNVACRILPVRIHDLDPDDKSTIERELGSVLRSVDFIYKEPGVNRSLTTEDHPDAKLNTTTYRNQVNKVANAVKDLLNALRHFGENQTAKTAPRNPTTAAPARRLPLKAIYSLAVLAVVVAAAVWLFKNVGGASAADPDLEKSIAVLPFTNLSDDPAQEYFSDGITDQIITNLSHLADVKVIARTSVLKYKGTTASISDIGSELNVNYVLEGSVQRSGDKLRINAQLIRTDDNFHEWAEIFNRNMTDIFEVQDDISQSIATALGNTLNSEELDKDRPSNTEAYDMYLKAKHIALTQYYFNRRNNISEAFNNAKSLYEQAIKLDTGFALAYAGLADLYDELRNQDAAAFPKELDTLRTRLARKAFALDPNSGFVNNVKAYVLFHNADPVNLDSAHYYLRRAYVLDPGDSYLSWCLGGFYDDAGLVEESLPLLKKSRDENPNDPKSLIALGMAFYKLGRTEEAETAVNKALLIGGGAEHYGIRAAIWWMAMSGQTARAKEMVARHRPNNDFFNAFLMAAEGNKEVLKSNYVRSNHYYLLGMYDEALRQLEKENPENWDPYIYLKYCPVWKPARDRPEYVRVLEKARIAHEATRKRYGFE